LYPVLYGWLEPIKPWVGHRAPLFVYVPTSIRMGIGPRETAFAAEQVA